LCVSAHFGKPEVAEYHTGSSIYFLFSYFKRIYALLGGGMGDRSSAGMLELEGSCEVMYYSCAGRGAQQHQLFPSVRPMNTGDNGDVFCCRAQCAFLLNRTDSLLLFLLRRSQPDHHLFHSFFFFQNISYKLFPAFTWFVTIF
jgi:hypothetical protein